MSGLSSPRRERNQMEKLKLWPQDWMGMTFRNLFGKRCWLSWCLGEGSHFETSLPPMQQARKLQATLEGCNPKLWITYSLTHSLTGVKCRATGVAKNSPDWESFCGIVISEPTVKHVQHVDLLHTSQHLKSSPWIFSSNQKLSPGNITQSTGSQKEYSNTHSSIWKKSSWCFGIHKSNSAGGFTIWT